MPRERSVGLGQPSPSDGVGVGRGDRLEEGDGRRLVAVAGPAERGGVEPVVAAVRGRRRRRAGPRRSPARRSWPPRGGRSRPCPWPGRGRRWRSRRSRAGRPPRPRGADPSWRRRGRGPDAPRRPGPRGRRDGSSRSSRSTAASSPASTAATRASTGSSVGTATPAATSTSSISGAPWSRASSIGVRPTVARRHPERSGRERRADVDAVVDQQPDPVGHAVGHGPRELAAEQLGRRVDGVTEASPPWTAVAASEPELEQQHEVRVVGLEHAVVERLPVVGVGAGFEEQASERQRVRVVRLRVRSALATAERAGERGERRGESVPEVARVRVGAGVEELPGDGQHVGLVDGGIEPRVGEVQRAAPTRRDRPRAGRRGGRR